MKLGIMQPYFIPYIGYWQLMNAVDKYVIYDDVNYIKGGWINRNRILVNGQPSFFNIPMLGASPNKKINEVGVNHDLKLMAKNLRILEGAYKKAPQYERVFPLVEAIFSSQQENIAGFIADSFQIINRYLGIQTEMILSSSLRKDCSLRGQDKVLAICEELGASEYYNAIGGQELYSFSDFRRRGIQLKFLQTELIEYTQFGGTFQPNLSILDVMMFNPPEIISEYLRKYTLVEENRP